MSSWPQPTRDHHQQFCKTEGWKKVRNARVGEVKHHETYELPLVSGQILRTHISRPVDKTTYGPRMWAHILRDQLSVSEDDFWACVQDGKVPDRGRPEAPRESLPTEMVHLLISTVGVPEDEVRQMTKKQAVERLNRFWAEGR